MKEVLNAGLSSNGLTDLEDHLKADNAFIAQGFPGPKQTAIRRGKAVRDEGLTSLFSFLLTVAYKGGQIKHRRGDHATPNTPRELAIGTESLVCIIRGIGDLLVFPSHSSPPR